MRPPLETGLPRLLPPEARDAARRALQDVLIPMHKNNGHANRALRMPAKARFEANFYFTFSPVLGFKNNTPLFLILLKLNI